MPPRNRADPQYAREKAEHLARQQAKEAALKRELAEKLERQAAAEREAHLVCHPEIDDALGVQS